MVTEITINFIWIDSNNEWQIPEEWDPHQFDEPVSVNLNEVAENWNDTQNLEFIAKKFISPPDFLSNPEFEVPHLSQMFKESSTAKNTLELLPTEWIELEKSLDSIDIDPSVIAVPHGMTPWDWYALSEEEKLGEMGLSQSESLRADGVLYTDSNSFYFDTYRFGLFSFDLVGDMKLESILNDRRFIAYCQEIVNRGPDSEFHTKCDEKCAFRTCSKMVLFPASISSW